MAPRNAFHDPLQAITNALTALGIVAHKSGDAYSTRCPAHEDSTPSFGFGARTDGSVWVKCHRGCSKPEILASLSLTENDLRPGQRTLIGPVFKNKTHKVNKTHDTFEIAIHAGERATGGKYITHWVYANTDGAEEFRVARFNLPGGTPGKKPEKQFRPFHQTPGGWVMADPPGPLPLYHLSEVMTATVVVLCEGERAADIARSLGYIATTSAHGSQAVKSTDWTPLCGKTVVAFPDNDEAGENYIKDAVAILHSLAVPTTVKTVKLPDLPPKGDIVEFVEARRAAGKDDAAIKMEIDGLIAAAQIDARATAVVEPVDLAWPEPKPLHTSTRAPAFPINTAFPPGLADLRDYIKAVATAQQVAVDLPAMTLLPIGGVALAQKWQIRLSQQWVEPGAYWTLTLAESGERKSRTLSIMRAPLDRWQQQEAERLRPLIAAARTTREIMEEQLKELKKKAKKGGPAAEEAKASAIRLAQEIAAFHIPTAPQLVVTEPTTEALADILADNQERAAVLSAEADAIEVVLGRYSDGKTPNMGVWLCGHSGDPYCAPRTSRPSRDLKHPILSVGFIIQPDSVQGMFTNRLARGKGYLARFLCSFPDSPIGYREMEPVPIPEHLERAYSAAIRRALELKIPERPTDLVLSPEAHQMFLAFREAVEKQLRPTGELANLRDWGSKLPGGIARIALELHVLEHAYAGTLDRITDSISAETMAAALEWAPYLIDQQMVVWGYIGIDHDTVVAGKILAWLQRTGVASFTRRDLHTAIRDTRHVQVVEDVDGPLALLVELGYIVREPEAPGHPKRPGKPASPVFAVNPRWDRGAQ